MSLAFIQGALGSAGAGDNARARADNRAYRQQVTADLQSASDRQSNLDTVNAMSVLARQLDVTSDAGMSIDPDKLKNKLQEQRDNGVFEPKVQQLVSMLGNQDFAVKNNPEFEFKGLSIGPEGSLTLQGGYKGKDGNRFLTVGREKGDEAPVAFSSVDQVAGLVADQYNQQWTKPGVADLYNEMTAREGIRTTGNTLTENEPKLRIAVSQLTNDLEGAIAQTASDPQKAAEQVTNLKAELANQPYHVKLRVLQDYGSRLQLPSVKEVITPEVEQAAQEDAAKNSVSTQQTSTVNPSEQNDNSSRINEIEVALRDRSFVNPMDGAKTVSEKEQALKDELAQLQDKPETTATTQPKMTVAQRNRTEKLLGNAKKNLAAAQKSGDKDSIERAQARVQKFESDLGVGQQDLTDPNPVIEAGAKKAAAASDEDIISGKTQITQEEIDALQARLKDEGITNMADLYKTSAATQQQFRLAISVLARDKETRRDYVNRFNNMIATGDPNYSPKDLASDSIAQQNADSSSSRARTSLAQHFQQVEKYNFDVGEKIGSRIRDNFTAAKKAIYGYDKKGKIGDKIDFDEGRFFSEFGSAFNSAYREYTNAKSAEAKAATQVALNSMISMGIQALAESEEYGSFGENFLPDGSIDFIDGNDALFSRLAKRPDGSVVVVDSNGVQQDESVPKSVLKKVFGNAGYGYFLKEIKGASGSVKDRANQNRDK